MGELKPIPKPPWLQDAYKPGGDEASQLIGMSILYKWPLRVGGWTLGKVQSVNTDASIEINGIMCDFKVFYSTDGTTADHCLTVRKYASKSSAANDSWVLLGDV